MMPVTHGKKQTIKSIVKYSFGLYIVTMFPYLFNYSGIIYFISALILGMIFLYLALRLQYNEDKGARDLFKYCKKNC